MQFSEFGNKFGGDSGITRLMDDLDQGIRAGDELIMLGGGNPASIPALDEVFANYLAQLLESGELLNQLCNYDGPQGNRKLIESLATYLSGFYGTDIGPENIALTNGSQSAFFYLFNLFAGASSHQSICKKVLLPLTPEYIGYADSGLSKEHFVACRPIIEKLENRRYKYHVDFEAVNSTLNDVGLICVSRPTNPTGNVISDEELFKLDAIAQERGIPLLIDNAYGAPFPNLIFKPVKAFWNQNTILCLSLSKLGLPGTRCGIVVANSKTIKAMTNLSGIINLAPGSIGPAILTPMLEGNDIDRISNDIIRPFYLKKSQQAVKLLQAAIPSDRFNIHVSEGAMFLWLWFDGLPIDDMQLYQRLKINGLLIVPGSYFFPGLAGDWKHRQQCIRLHFAQSDDDMIRGIKTLASIINPLLD
ncbi:valine--pyruvate transaminase [Alginatibacterium sediminis]|uniref:Valine--pyruvate transaminase n=1 Tax=Alginatibacterium sediminis TaxID=2164068 RepID=A0A420ENM6_9ALTE|nr:valine--pyruvate transaminase [Alginatibacterium sediminis]RKF22263.1 valine--pyruvate transaminase [Alginatibacterium sediminis]